MSKITHEEARTDTDIIFENLPDQLEPKLLDARRIRRLKAYITQQEEKDEISLVKDEIISLYRDYVFSDKLSERIVIREKIAALEVKYNLRKLECE